MAAIQVNNSHGVTFRDCHFDACPCDRPMVLVESNAAGCGHCGEVIYPDVRVVADHAFRCEGGITIWFSVGMQIEVHRCGDEAVTLVDQSASELTPIFV